MAQLVRTEVSAHLAGDPPKDWQTNVVYHRITNDFDITSETDFHNHAQQVIDCFTGHAANHPGGDNLRNWNVQGKCYLMSDAEPRPIRALVLFGPSATLTRADFAPESIALCLSFYAGRNILGSRSRIYLGGWLPGDVTADMVGSEPMAKAIATGHALFDVGGENVAHVIRTTGTQVSARGVRPVVYAATKSGHQPGDVQVVTDYWVDNRWDVMRKRLRAATSRSTVHP